MRRLARAGQSALLARYPHEKLHAGDDASGQVKIVRGLVDPPAGFALNPDD